MAIEKTYPVPLLGYGSQFPETERPPTYASQLVNRFVNPGGAAETRRGLTQLGNTIANVSAPDLKTLHELVGIGGTARLMVGGSVATGGRMRLWKLDTSAESTWTQAYASGAVSAKFQTVQFDEKLIIVNSEDRNLYTTDASAFQQLLPLIQTGEALTTSSAQDRLRDAEVFGSTAPIVDWLVGTNVAINDLFFDVTTSAAAMITDIVTSSLAHQALTAASQGFMSGNAVKQGGDRYQIRDLVELNIIPVGGQDPDNVAIAGVGTNTIRTQVSLNSGLLNFANTELRVGDIFNNTTRNAVARITRVSGNEISHTTVASQSQGDSLTFHKYAMPITERAHVHYGRAAYLDARDETKIRFSGPGDPQDLTTDAGTLDSTTFHAGAQQPGGGVIITMGTFQQFMAFAGRRFIALFSGTDPIKDTSAAAKSFTPSAIFPLGVAGSECMLSIGNDLLFLAPEGMQAASLRGDQTTPTREILSDALRDEIRAEVSATPEDDLQLVHYPMRSQIFVKASAGRLFVYSYGPNLMAQSRLEGDPSQPGQKGSWSVYDGRFSKMNSYFVRQNTRLVCCDSSGRVFRFDDDTVFSDGNTAAGTYTTRLQTSWLGLDESNRGLGRPTRKQKKGVYFKLAAQGSANNTYTIRCTAPYTAESGETVTETLSASDDPVSTPKIALTWRGERVRVDIQTTARGAESLSHITIGYNEYGSR